MQTFILWVLLTMSDGSHALVLAGTYATPQDCRQAQVAHVTRAARRPDVGFVRSVCMPGHVL